MQEDAPLEVIDKAREEMKNKKRRGSRKVAEDSPDNSETDALKKNDDLNPQDDKQLQKERVIREQEYKRNKLNQFWKDRLADKIKPGQIK